MTRYFGQNQDIKKFAKKLLQHKNLYQHADALRELNKTIAVLGPDAPSSKIMSKIKEKYDLYWMDLGDKPYSTRAPGPNGGLPDTREAWSAIRSLALRYGWHRQAGFLGVRFNRIKSNEQIRCFSPEEARQLMDIPLEEAFRELASKNMK